MKNLKASAISGKYSRTESIMNDLLIAVKMSMGDSQLAKWNFHSTFRFVHVAQREGGTLHCQT